jgi:uncharacterized phiE125 gp8 family phage protein
LSSWFSYGGGGPYGTYGGLYYGALVPYGTRILTETSPPQSFTEPLQLADVKAYLKIPDRSPADTYEDALVQSLISGARAAAEEAQGGSELIVRQWDHYFDYWPSYRLELGNPLVSVDLVQYQDSDGVFHALTTDVDYLVDTVKKPGVLMPTWNNTWPTFQAWPSSSVLIRYTSGYAATNAWWTGEIGQMVLNGMRLLISDWYNNRLPWDTPLKEMPYALQICLAGDSTPRAR